ncbi:glycosyltransferase family 4 protein [Desulfosporosinus metallidurans]|uniref:Putative glycosyltransferase n=1 Tax=Desulfosporosinus metallidurans TaxID=1888891 RepID=A0A1Q8QXU4_9FIRM|nr:glycosyltransferase family 4 protein [Desulfosporosinus metallidurans]OLN32163.1 putative glycosyltransferase [Desulfosporosinus metallidurans]
MNKDLRIAFVTPWYGPDIPGGAEAELRGLAERLSQYGEGVVIEVLTTCVKEFMSDWSENYHKPSSEVIRGVKVTRFPVRKRDTLEFDKVNFKLMSKLTLTNIEEQKFFSEMIRSPEMEKYISLNCNHFDLFIFIPYMFGTTFWGIQACPERSIIIPCLHEESYAYMGLVKEMFSLVKGIVFLAQPEKELALKLYDISRTETEVLGGGVDTNYKGYPDEFRRKFGIDGPIVLYAGRKDKGKNVDGLLKSYYTFKQRYPFDNSRLILIGGGDIEVPQELRKHVVDLGFVSQQDKYDAYEAAAVLCQPSVNESFSIVIMESWFSGTPVIVNGRCAVTKDFCTTANGGLYYDNDFEFSEALWWLLNNQKAGKKLGTQGRDFVLEHFTWNAIISRYLEFFRKVSDRGDGV